MSSRLLRFLDLDGARSAGRWFVAVLVVAFCVVGYMVITDWAANTNAQRVKGIVFLVMDIVLAMFYARSGTQGRRPDNVDPPA